MLVLVLTSVLVGPVDEEVHGSHLGDLLLLAVEPQHLLAAALQRLVLHGDGGAVVPAEVRQKPAGSVFSRCWVGCCSGGGQGAGEVGGAVGTLHKPQAEAEDQSR